MSEKKFSKKHEWVELIGDIATVGITKHATEMLGDIVFVEVPDNGKSVDKDGQAAVVGSREAKNDTFFPFSSTSIYFSAVEITRKEIKSSKRIRLGKKESD